MAAGMAKMASAISRRVGFLAKPSTAITSAMEPMAAPMAARAESQKPEPVA